MEDELVIYFFLYFAFLTAAATTTTTAVKDMLMTIITLMNIGFWAYGLAIGYYLLKTFWAAYKTKSFIKVKEKENTLHRYNQKRTQTTND